LCWGYMIEKVYIMFFPEYCRESYDILHRFYSTCMLIIWKSHNCIIIHNNPDQKCLYNIEILNKQRETYTLTLLSLNKSKYVCIHTCIHTEHLHLTYSRSVCPFRAWTFQSRKSRLNCYNFHAVFCKFLNVDLQIANVGEVSTCTFFTAVLT
jgi:hypothetical protein